MLWSAYGMHDISRRSFPLTEHYVTSKNMVDDLIH